MNKRGVVIGVATIATIAAGVGAYIALPQETKNNVKQFVKKMSNKMSKQKVYDDDMMN